jgi:hypothetical protein
MIQTNYNEKSKDIQLHAPEAEEGLLSAILIDPTWLDRIELDPADIYIHRHRMIFESMLALKGQGIIPDAVTVCEELTRRGQLQEVRGASEITRLISLTLWQADEYVKTIQDYAARRKAKIQAEEIIRNAYDLTQPMPGVISHNGHKQEPSTWADLADIIGPIEWCWNQWLPKGMLTIVAGESGQGKSALLLRIAASFINGDPWPDGTKFTGETGAVLWCETEAAEILNYNRALAWGLPIDKIYTPYADPVKGWTLDDTDVVLQMALDDDVKLIVIDSLSGGNIGGKENDGEMLQKIKPIAEIARDTGKPIMLSHHLNKPSFFDNGKIDLNRLRGSSTIVQTARLVWTLDTPDPQAKNWQRIQVIKSNLGKFPESIGMSINDYGIKFGLAPEEPKKESVGDRAADLLLALLDEEPKPANEILQEFKEAGISEASLYRAKDKLKIVSRKDKEGWSWGLPEKRDYVN